jgi:ribosomal protein S12 methylthiotransferase accessory factor
VDSISTGTACARSRDEATLKAIWEAVERDAVSIAWFNSLVMPRIDLDGDDEIGRLNRERFSIPGSRYVMVDVTLDIPIPTFVGFLIDERGGTIISSATRLSPRAAAEKTLVEASQGRVAWKREVVTGPPERFAEDFHDVINFPEHSKVYMLREMRPHIEAFWSSPEVVRVDDLPDRSTGNVAEDLRITVELLRGAGLETIAVDVTTDDVREAGYWVVRAVIPGLQAINSRHDAPQFGGTRMYDVPFKMGYRDRPTREDELNQFIHPFP